MQHDHKYLQFFSSIYDLFSSLNVGVLKSNLNDRFPSPSKFSAVSIPIQQLHQFERDIRISYITHPSSFPLA
jgi:hypothetical protein